MRNLKKILAMVLALVMSLSLMANAGAADFTDASSINEKYETAIEVLEGLGVFKGYQDGTFQPQGSITRAETAAIIYRIVTGDVKDEQVGIYADYNLFTDVPSTSWFAGYVNYCANAEYIKGVGGGKFNPNAQVTGYAALAMILRAIGYTANGGFTGSDWEVQTARTAEARKITKNIMTGTLGQNANRETVAEILFQAILVNMVDHNILNTNNGNQGYTEIDETLGYKTFKLEQIEGVVVGNEFADLNSSQVLPEGKTALQVADEAAPRTLNVTTKVTDVGESRLVYTQNVSKVLSLADTGKNKVTQFGHACEIDTTAKFNAAAEMPAAADIEYYVNFDRVGNYTCDQRLEFLVTFQTADAENSFNGYIGNNIASIAARDNSDDVPGNNWTITWTGDTYPVTYNKIIRANNDISDDDLDVIRGIFGAADNAMNNGIVQNQITGDVYVGTKSTPTTSDEERDLSNTISYKKFFEDYINAEIFDRNWEESFNGWWVKFVDYDGDGECDYAFCTVAFLDEVVGTYTNKAGDTVMQYNWFNDDDHTDREDYTVRYMDKDEPMERDVAVGDKVIAVWIDNQYLVGHADSVTKTVNKYNWKTDIITTTDGDEYGQSLISNATDMMELISTMDEKTEYIMYLDSFGYVRAYEIPGGTNYALVTELYYTNGNQGNLVQNWPMTVELWNGAEGKGEYNLANANGNVFNAAAVANMPVGGSWTEVQNVASRGNYYNWLQPAIAHLGVTRTGFGPTRAVPTFGDARYSFWPDFYQVAKQIDSLNGSTEFDYGPYSWTGKNSLGVDTNYTSNVTTSFTNVAIANVNGADATIQGAARLRTNSRNEVLTWNDIDGNEIYTPGTAERPRYAVDYIQLSTDDVNAGAVRYPISGTGTYAQDNNYYVNAIHDTQYYIIYNGDVLYFKDYANMPKLTNEKNNIRAAYAVARDTSSDIDRVPYWVADVIVYEIQEFDDSAKSSISLAYFNPTRTTGDVRLLETLNNKSENAMINVIPKPETWGADKGSFGNYSGYGFYDLYNTELLESGELAAAKIAPITRDFNANGIYAGKVVRVRTLGTAGDYLDVNLTGTYEADGTTLKTEASVKLENNIYSITNDTVLGSSNQEGYNEAKLLQYNNTGWSEVKAGDRVIWVGGSGGTGVNSAAFIVNIGHYDSDPNFSNTEIYDNTAAFLGARNALRPDMDPNAAGRYSNAGGPLWKVIYDEQVNYTTAVWNITYTFVDEDGNEIDPAPANTLAPTARLKSLSEKAVEITGGVTGYDVTGMVVTTLNDKGDAPAADCYLTAGKWYLNNITKDITVEVTITPSVEKFDITLKGTGLPAGTTIEKTYKIAATELKSIDLTTADFTVFGYEITAVANGTPSSGATLTVAPSGATTPKTSVSVATPTSDGEITLTYAPIVVSATVSPTNTGGGTALTAANIAWSITKEDGTAGAIGNCGTMPTTAQLAYGDTLTLTWTGAANETYTVGGASAATSNFANGLLDYKGTVTNAYTITGVVKGAVSLTIDAGTLPGLTFLPGSGVSTTTASAGVAKVTLPTANTIHKGEAVTIIAANVSANTGDTVLGLTWTQYGENGGSGSFTKEANGDWTVPAGTINGDGDVIISAKVVTDANNTVTVTNNTGLNLLGAKYDADGDPDGTAAAVAIAPNGSYVIQAAPGTVLNCAVTSGDGNAVITGEGTDTITIANVVGAVAITLTVAAGN